MADKNNQRPIEIDGGFKPLDEGFQPTVPKGYRPAAEPDKGPGAGHQPPATGEDRPALPTTGTGIKPPAEKPKK